MPAGIKERVAVTILSSFISYSGHKFRATPGTDVQRPLAILVIIMITEIRLWSLAKKNGSVYRWQSGAKPRAAVLIAGRNGNPAKREKFYRGLFEWGRPVHATPWK